MVILGDFNMVPDLVKGRMSTSGQLHSGLVEWAEMYAWRWRNPHFRAYTCHSASHRSFSRIDLANVGRSALSRVADIRIFPRGISDHAPLFLTMELSSAPETTLWRLSRFWVSDEEVDGQYRERH